MICLIKSCAWNKSIIKILAASASGLKNTFFQPVFSEQPATSQSVTGTYSASAGLVGVPSALFPITGSNSQPEQPTPARAISAPAAVIYKPMTRDMLPLACGSVGRSLSLWQGVCCEIDIALTGDISATE